MSLISLIFGESQYEKARKDAKDFYLHGKITKDEYIALVDRINEEEELDNI